MIAGTWATVFCSVRSCGRGALVLHLGLFIYPLSLHTTRDGVGSSGPAGSQEVSVTLSDFKVSASTTTFSPGMPYHFVVTNNGKMAHEFMILPPLAGMGSMSMDDLHKQSLVMIESIAPGESKTVDVTFPSSSVGSSLELACHLPGHYEAGMKLPITVSK